MKKLFILIFISLLSFNSFAKTMKLKQTVMFTNNWYTANTTDETSSIEINFPDEWDASSSVINNEKGEKIAEGVGSFLYKINPGERYKGVIVEKIRNADYEPSKIIERREGKTANGYLFDLEITATAAYSDEGWIIWYPCKFFVYNLDSCFRITFYARNEDYQKELESFIKIVDTVKFPVIENDVMNDDNVRIRKEPNLKSETVGKLNRQDKVKIIGSTISTMKIDRMESKWYKILLDNNTVGWVYGAFVDIDG